VAGLLEADLAAIDAEHAALMAAVRRGGDVETLARLVGRLQDLQSRRATLTSKSTARPAIASPGLGRGLEARLRAQLADWRGLLTRNVESGREVLKTLLAEPFKFTPEIDARGRRYRFTGAIALDRVVAGVIDLKTCDRVPSPAGTAHGWRPMPLRGFYERIAA
jgi:hypothetical protein